MTQLVILGILNIINGSCETILYGKATSACIPGKKPLSLLGITFIGGIFGKDGTNIQGEPRIIFHIFQLQLCLLKNSGHDIYIIFFNQKFANGMNEVLSWFGINLLASVQDITQNMFCNLAKISYPADLQIYYFNLELAIELN